MDAEGEFVRLLTEHQSSLRGYIVSLMPGLPGSEDVLQETNIALWKKRDRFQPGSNFTAWSFAVARYSTMEHRRKARRDQRLVFSDDLLETLAASPDEIAPPQTEARRTALEGCLARLTEADRTLIQRRYGRGTTVQDYSDSAGRSAGALRISLFRIRAALRRCINQYLATCGDLP